jgi:hypothetical protein
MFGCSDIFDESTHWHWQVAEKLLQHTAHKQADSKSTGSEDQICINKIVDCTLEYGEKSKANTSSANAEPELDQQ